MLDDVLLDTCDVTDTGARLAITRGAETELELTLELEVDVETCGNKL